MNGGLHRKDKVLPSPKLDRFADLLALEYSIADAAKIMGLRPTTGKTMLRRLCERLGSQAV